MMDPRHDNVNNVNGCYQMPPQMPAPPPVYNPPPQIFGGYAADGLPNMSLPDLSQNLFPDATLMDESIEAKRRRIARVCIPFFISFVLGTLASDLDWVWRLVKDEG